MGDVVGEICQWDQRKMCFNKQQVKDAVTYFSFNCYFTFGPKILCQIIGILIWSFFANLFLYFYESMRMTKINKNDLTKSRKLSKMLRFIDDLNSVDDLI